MVSSDVTCPSWFATSRLFSAFLDTVRFRALAKLSWTLCRLVFFFCSAQCPRRRVRPSGSMDLKLPFKSANMFQRPSSPLPCTGSTDTFFNTTVVELMVLCPRCWCRVDVQVFQSFSHGVGFSWPHRGAVFRELCSSASSKTLTVFEVRRQFFHHLWRSFGNRSCERNASCGIRVHLPCPVGACFLVDLMMQPNASFFAGNTTVDHDAMSRSDRCAELAHRPDSIRFRRSMGFQTAGRGGRTVRRFVKAPSALCPYVKWTHGQAWIVGVPVFSPAFSQPAASVRICIAHDRRTLLAMMHDKRHEMPLRSGITVGTILTTFDNCQRAVTHT